VLNAAQRYEEAQGSEGVTPRITISEVMAGQFEIPVA
jgi:hypothetical protein